MASDSPDYQAYVEEYHSDQSDAVPFKGRKSPSSSSSPPAVANVSTKRSHPSDLDKEKPPALAHVHADHRSDSGYSSVTHATVGSADSAPSATAAPASAAAASSKPAASKPSTPIPTAPTPPTAAVKPRRPTLSQRVDNLPPETLGRRDSHVSRPSAMRRPTLSSHDKRERRNSRAVVDNECTDPTCLDCGPMAPPHRQPPRRRPDLHQPSQSARDVSRLVSTSDQRSMHSDPATYYSSPPSPPLVRQQPRYAAQGTAIIQPAMSRPRASSRVRPTSYNGEPGPRYHASGMALSYPSPPQERERERERERGPPVSNSAAYQRGASQYHVAPSMVPYNMASSTQVPGYYPTQYNHNQTSPYESLQRPALAQRRPSIYGTHGTRNGGPAPLVMQPPREPTRPSARYGIQAQSATQPSFPPPLQIEDESYSSQEQDSSSDEESYQGSARAPRLPRAPPAPPAAPAPPPLMPPPKIKRSKSKAQRPTMIHAHTTQGPDVDRKSRRQSIIHDRSSRETHRREHESLPSRPRSRPAPAHTQSDYVSSRGQVTVNKADRRRSGQLYHMDYQEYARARDREQAQSALDAKEARAAERAAAEARAIEKVKARVLAKAQAHAAHEERYQAERSAERKQRNAKSRGYNPPGAFESDGYEDDEVVVDDHDHDHDHNNDHYHDSESASESDKDFEPTPAALRRSRRPTVTEKPKKRATVITKSKRITDAAEDYISAQRGSRESYADQTYQVAKRKSRSHLTSEDSGSSHSKGSDRQSQSNRTAVTSNGSNEIRLRVDASAPLSLAFNGDMEGRNLQIVPTGDGMADIIIGGRNGESTYHGSERGSIMGNTPKAIMPSQARRDAEEIMTERSAHSNRSRRESRVLRDLRDSRDLEHHPLRRYRG